jgi:acyl-coenzyme A thioesterase PaaI-like protein
MSAETGSFYVAVDEGRFRATELTASPWGPGSQHGGPPSALLGRALEAVASEQGGVFARLTFEILGPIPVGELSVEAKTLRPGRRVSLREATLSDGAGRPVMLCRAWHISASPASLPDDLDPPTLPGPDEGQEKPFFEMAPEVGYHQGIEARFVAGSWRELGHAAAWLRMRVPLLPGEEPSPLVRVLVAADSGNGVGAALDTSEWTFVNLETTIHLHAYPGGEWVGLESSAVVRPSGVGLARTTIHDPVLGPVGAAAQSLLVAER